MAAGLRTDLATAATSKSVFGFRSYERSWQVASRMLLPSETVEVAAIARRVITATTGGRVQGKNADWGVLIVSDQRLLFIRARLLTTASEEIPFTNISGVVHQHGLTQGQIKVTVAGGITTTFHGIPVRRLAEIVKAIQSQLTRLQASPAQSSLPVSAADEIKKLAELRDSGILTEREFSARKRRILGS